MNRNKKTKNKKVNEAISNMEDTASFKSLNDMDNNKLQVKKNRPEELS